MPVPLNIVKGLLDKKKNLSYSPGPLPCAGGQALGHARRGSTAMSVNMYRWVQMWRFKPVLPMSLSLSGWESDSVHFQTSDGYCGVLFELLTDVQRALVAVKA